MINSFWPPLFAQSRRIQVFSNHGFVCAPQTRFDSGNLMMMMRSSERQVNRMCRVRDEKLVHCFANEIGIIVATYVFDFIPILAQLGTPLK